MSMASRLRSDLTSAIRSKNKTEISQLRTLIAAIENAEAIEADDSIEPKIGLNHDRPRHELNDEEITSIIARERAEIAEAAASYRELGLIDEPKELEERLAILDRYTA